MYAAGVDHPLKQPCVGVVKALKSGNIEGHTSTEVVQEVLQRYASIGRRQLAVTLASDIVDGMSPLIPVTEAIMIRVIELMDTYPKAQTRDLVHVATCVEADIAQIVTPDRDFKHFKEVEQVDPASLARL